MRLTFSAELWDYRGEGSWHFVTVPPELSEEIGERAGPRRGFGSVRVQVTIGGPTWSTSVFPSKPDAYVLPVKRPVRVKEGIEVGAVVDVVLEVLD